jgi:hypothetical protein
MKFFKSQAFRAGWRTFIQSFLGLFLISLIGWLQQVVTWATASDQVFPNTDVLLKAAVTATAAAFIALIAFIQNKVENKAGASVPGMPRGAEPPTTAN